MSAPTHEQLIEAGFTPISRNAAHAPPVQVDPALGAATMAYDTAGQTDVTYRVPAMEQGPKPTQFQVEGLGPRDGQQQRLRTESYKVFNVPVGNLLSILMPTQKLIELKGEHLFKREKDTKVELIKQFEEQNKGMDTDEEQRFYGYYMDAKSVIKLANHGLFKTDPLVKSQAKVLRAKVMEVHPKFTDSEADKAVAESMPLGVTSCELYVPAEFRVALGRLIAALGSVFESIDKLDAAQATIIESGKFADLHKLRVLLAQHYLQWYTEVFTKREKEFWTTLTGCKAVLQLHLFPRGLDQLREVFGPLHSAADWAQSNLCYQGVVGWAEPLSKVLQIKRVLPMLPDLKEKFQDREPTEDDYPMVMQALQDRVNLLAAEEALRQRREAQAREQEEQEQAEGQDGQEAASKTEEAAQVEPTEEQAQ